MARFSLSSSLSVARVFFVSSYCEDRAFLHDLTWQVKSGLQVAPAIRTQGEQNLNRMPGGSPNSGWGATATTRAAGSSQANGTVRGGKQTRAQGLKPSPARRCGESGVESHPAPGEKDPRLIKPGGGSICEPRREGGKGQHPTGLARVPGTRTSELPAG